MKFVLTLFSSLIISNFAFAAEDHTQEFCNDQYPEICLHLGFHNGKTANTPVNFMIHFMEAESFDSNLLSDVTALSYLNVENSSPEVLSVKKLDNTHYRAQNVIFKEVGEYEIAVVFEYDHQPLLIKVPLEINE